MEGTVSDLKNLGPREGGAMTAAAFLSHFVPDTISWAHLDIAGTAWAEAGEPLGPQGATGFGARLLARAVQILAG
jgi:leucyl aminopeptidase